MATNRGRVLAIQDVLWQLRTCYGKDVFWQLGTCFGNKDVFWKFDRYYIVLPLNILIIINIDKTWKTMEQVQSMIILSIQETRLLLSRRRSLPKDSKGCRGFKKFATYAMGQIKCGV